MRWVVRIELKEDEAEVSADSGAICIERTRLEDAAELGLTLEDGKRVMAVLQNRVYLVAVDRAVIRRGLELRYPWCSIAEMRALPPVVDPDEYIEKAITLSFDLPLLEDADGRALLAVTDLEHPLSNEEGDSIVSVLGTNPRRLKRFGTIFALWCDVARALTENGKRALGFSPLAPADWALFLKLSLIGYLNSGVLAEMRRDPGVAPRSQNVCNAIIP